MFIKRTNAKTITMKKIIKSTFSEVELRQLIREEVQAVLSTIPGLPRIEANEGFITVDQTADFIKLAKPTIYGLIHRNKIPFHKSGKKVLFKKSELEDWLNNRI